MGKKKNSNQNSLNQKMFSTKKKKKTQAKKINKDPNQNYYLLHYYKLLNIYF